MHCKLAALVAAAFATLAILPADSVGDTIGRANLDGSSANRSFMPGISFPSGVEVDPGHIYWSDITTNAIGRANLSGTGANPSFITGADGPFAVAVDAQHAYWVDYDTGTIGRANLDGTRIDQGFVTGANQPAGVAVDAHHVYLANSYADTIGRANLNGTGAKQNFIVHASYSQDVAVDSGHVYWANEGRANLDGTGDNAGTIGRANLNGTGIDQSFIPGAREARGVAVDAKHVYWSESPSPTLSVSVQNTALVVEAGPGMADDISITRPSRFTFRVTDLPGGAYSGAAVRTGHGCTPGGDYTANCPASGITPVLPVLVRSGDRADRVVNSSGLPSSLYGEGGDDLLVGGPDGDILKGGPGVDVMRGLEAATCCAQEMGPLTGSSTAAAELTKQTST